MGYERFLSNGQPLAVLGSQQTILKSLQHFEILSLASVLDEQIWSAKNVLILLKMQKHTFLYATFCTSPVWQKQLLLTDYYNDNSYAFGAGRTRMRFAGWEVQNQNGVEVFVDVPDLTQNASPISSNGDDTISLRSTPTPRFYWQ